MSLDESGSLSVSYCLLYISVGRYYPHSTFEETEAWNGLRNSLKATQLVSGKARIQA